MLKHIRPGEEIVATVKLLNGEDVIGKCMVIPEDEEREDTPLMLVVENPCQARFVESEDSEEGDESYRVAFYPWSPFSDDEFTVFDDQHVLSLTPLKDEFKVMYNMYVVSKLREKYPDLEPKKKKPKQVSTDIGFVDSVENMRKKLDDLFNK
jgi:hypothetical protein